MPYPQKTDLIVRFWKYVDKTPGHGPNGDCWQWTGKPLVPHGYGRLGQRGAGKHSSIYAHRLSYEIHNQKIPPRSRLVVSHLCHNRLCVNPAHLKLCTQHQNCRDGNLARGERHGQSKLTEEAVREIRNLYGKPLPPEMHRTKAPGVPGLKFTNLWTEGHLARKYGVTRLTIHSVLTGEAWSHVT